MIILAINAALRLAQWALVVYFAYVAISGSMWNGDSFWIGGILGVVIFGTIDDMMIRHQRRHIQFQNAVIVALVEELKVLFPGDANDRVDP